jgi:hypothetical protein
MSATPVDAIAGPLRPANRNPLLAQALSIVPGLGQVYYGAYVRGAQYFAGVVGSIVLAAATYIYSFDLANLHAGPVFTSIAFIVSELVALSLVVCFFSFWIAAWWDAKQGSLARIDGRVHAPKWWFVKVKEFLFDDPEDEIGERHE